MPIRNIKAPSTQTVSALPSPANAKGGYKSTTNSRARVTTAATSAHTTGLKMAVAASKQSNATYITDTTSGRTTNGAQY